MQGLHPLSLFEKSASKIQQWNVPFLNRGAPAECCDGAKLCRFGHKTVAVRCYVTTLTSGTTVCAHCEELWALVDDNLVYKLSDDMKQACKVYEKGE